MLRVRHPPFEKVGTLGICSRTIIRCIMSLQAGIRLGPYEITGALGAGGMGEVYRARDTRLARDVAVKVLPAAFSHDADRLRRFKQEAQAAAALNSPSILAIYDFGEYEGATYIVSELLEGETLRARLSFGAIAVRKATEYALQIVRGLAAAHEKAIVHRDLKPENIFLTKAGGVKILDFGLAKLTRPEDSPGNAATITACTEPGVILGTVGYMSPEQVRAEAVDHRSDLFSFGATLYEMLSGKNAFRRGTSVETMNAILKEEPPGLTEGNHTVPSALDRIVRHCLEKNPEERFRSAWDLGFALEGLSAAFDSGLAPPGPRAGIWSRSSWLRIALLALGLAISGAIGLLAGWQITPTSSIRFEDVVLRRGQFGQARFAADGRTVVYTAGFRFGERGLYVADVNTQVGRALGLPNAELLAVSSNRELAVLLSAHPIHEHSGPSIVGILARVPLSGGTPHEVLENVQSADWSPDGSQLAVARYSAVGKSYALEYPIGHVLYQTEGYISDIRVSPDGKLIAFMDHPILGDTRGTVAVVDTSGKHKTISAEAMSEMGLAWSSSSKQVWFTNENGLWAANLDGKAHSLMSVTGALSGALLLDDIASDGNVLLCQASGGNSMILHNWSKTGSERDLSWLDASFVTDISEDGQLVLFNEQGFGGGPEYTSYIRKTDGSPAVQLGPGRSTTISPDKQWAITVGMKSPEQLFLVPLKVGESRQLTNDSINHFLPFGCLTGLNFCFPVRNRVTELASTSKVSMAAHPRRLRPRAASQP